MHVPHMYSHDIAVMCNMYDIDTKAKTPVSEKLAKLIRSTLL
jgi:hypothetical protein